MVKNNFDEVIFKIYLEISHFGAKNASECIKYSNLMK